MLDPVIEFFSRTFYLIGRGIGQLVAWALWPFAKLYAFYVSTGFIWKSLIGLTVAAIVIAYSWLGYNAVVLPGYDPEFVEVYDLSDRKISAGEAVSTSSTGSTRTCGRSAIVDVAADLIDFNVNQNAWISSMLTYKSGFFGLDWDSTPFLDNKASFQRGIHSAVQRVSVELVDSLGRVRGTSQIDPDLREARGQINYDMSSWYFGISPFGFKQSSPSAYRVGMQKLRSFNDRLVTCEATFDARADNLSTFLDAVTSQIGSTSAKLDERSKSVNLGWFDTQADNNFWEAMGELYAYHAFMHAAHADFEDIVTTKALGANWDKLEVQLRSSLDLNPFIISNGREDGWMMPTHLTTLGFKILSVRTSMTEMRDILKQ